MEWKELKKKSDTDLRKILGESCEKLRDLRFKDANKQLKNVREIRIVRRTIARTKMLLRRGANRTEQASADKTPEPKK